MLQQAPLLSLAMDWCLLALTESWTRSALRHTTSVFNLTENSTDRHVEEKVYMWSKFNGLSVKLGVIPPTPTWHPLASLKFNIYWRKNKWKRNLICLQGSFWPCMGQSPRLTTSSGQEQTIFTVPRLEKIHSTTWNSWRHTQISVVLNVLSRQPLSWFCNPSCGPWVYLCDSGVPEARMKRRQRRELKKLSLEKLVLKATQNPLWYLTTPFWGKRKDWGSEISVSNPTVRILFLPPPHSRYMAGAEPLCGSIHFLLQSRACDHVRKAQLFLASWNPSKVEQLHGMWPPS